MAENVNGQEKLTALGERIKAQRELLGLSIKEVQEHTKIRSTYLTAVEEGNDNILPGKAYFRVFLKSYAEFLGLDGTEFAREYLKISDVPVEKPALYSHEQMDASESKGETKSVAQPRTRSPRRRRSKRNSGAAKLLVALIVLVACVWGATTLWQNYNAARHNEDPLNGQLPDPGGEQTPDDQEPPSDPINTVIVNRTDPGPEISVFETNESPMSITLRTMEGEDATCWIRAMADGVLIEEKTMSPGETVVFSVEKEATVRAGKPWVLSVALNGEDLGVGGPYGPVKDLVFRYNQEM